MAGFSQDPGKINYVEGGGPIDYPPAPSMERPGPELQAHREGRKQMIRAVLLRMSDLGAEYASRRLNGGSAKTYGEAMADVNALLLQIVAEEIGTPGSKL